MIPAQRRAMVLEQVQRRGTISIQELVEVIAVSSSTVRRDLEELEAEGLLERTRGGALVQSTRRSTYEPTTAVAAGLAREEKKAIAKYAIGMLRSGQSVIFDSSTTVREVAYLVVSSGLPITALTNDLGIGEVLGSSNLVTVIIPGGTLRPGSLTLKGEPGLEFWRTIRADVLLLGTHAISEGSLSETSLDLAAQKRLMISTAERVVLLADSGKFQSPAFCQICSLSTVSEIVTDSKISDADLQMIADHGVKVQIVAVDSRPHRGATN